MIEGVPLEDPADYKKAIARIKRLWNEGYVTWTTHAQQRMIERKIDILDIRKVIRYGQIVEHSCPGRLWRYRIDGSAVDGKRIGCVVEIDGQLIIITVINLRRR